MIDRARRYLYHIVAEVDERGCRCDLALLPMIESAINPERAVARARRRHLAVHAVDRQPLRARAERSGSTRAATSSPPPTPRSTTSCKLYGDFDDWQLALAAYNWGEGNVARAIEATGRRGKPGDYASLAMPVETRNYLPKLQAMKNIVRDPEKYGLVLADIPDAPYFTVVKTTREDGREAWRPSWPRCRSTSSWRSIRSTTGR